MDALYNYTERHIFAFLSDFGLHKISCPSHVGGNFNKHDVNQHRPTPHSWCDNVTDNTTTLENSQSHELSKTMMKCHGKSMIQLPSFLRKGKMLQICEGQGVLNFLRISAIHVSQKGNLAYPL